LLAKRSQFPFQGAFPLHPPFDTFAEPLGLNSLIDDIWDLRRKHERRFDPLLYLGNDVMHKVLLYAVSLWDIAESRAWGTEIIPRNYMSDPLELINVSRRWSLFITSSPQLWSYVLIDTDDEDVLEYLPLFFRLSCNTKLFIILQGSVALCDTLLVDLLGVGDRIGTLLYPPNVSRSMLARFRFHLGASHYSLEHVCRWYTLELQSLNHYSFPISIQSLWMGGLLPLSRLVTLSRFQSLSFLSVRVSLDMAAHNDKLELPRLEVLRVQVALASYHHVHTPINMICRNLKRLGLRYRLELDLENMQEDPATWMEFDGVGALEELQIDLEIHVATEVDSVERLAALLQKQQREPHGLQGLQEMDLQEQLERQQLERLERQQMERQQLEQQQLEQQLESQRLERLERLEWEEMGPQEQLERQNQLEQERWWDQLEQRRLERLDRLESEELGPQEQLDQEQLYQDQLLDQLDQLEPLEGEQLLEMGSRLQLWQRSQQEQDQQLHFMMSIYTDWRKWLNLPNSLTHVQQSSLRVTLSAQMHRMHQGASRVIKNMVEEILVWRVPQLTELTTSEVLRIFPKHLRKLRLYIFAMSDSLPSIALPNLISLEIIADSLDHLLVMGYIQAPRLRVLRVQVEDGPGMLHKHDWGAITNNLLDHISLRINIPRDKQGDHVLFFHLPQTQSLNIFSPSRPLHLYLAKQAPLFYILNAGLGTMSGPSHGQVRSISAVWNEELVTEWINPCGTPNLATFKTLISLQQIVLSQRLYMLSEQSPADTLFKLLEQNLDTCPQLSSVTVAQCPSSWPRFLFQLRKRNREAMLRKETKCIEELGFYQPLHATIINWLVDAINAKTLNVIERPPIREGNAWPMRPCEAERVVRSCYVCHITGMELGCLEYETRNADCGRERDEGPKICAGYH